VSLRDEFASSVERSTNLTGENEMAHYGILKDMPIRAAAEDVRGAHLYGLNDEKLGKIDNVIFDHSTGNIQYVVVDTGGWLTTKKFIVPAHGLRASAKHEDDFEADLTKERVESFPPYNESDLDSEKTWTGYEGRYRSEWVAKPVMHRAETDRNLTPTTQQTSGNLESEQAAAEAHGVSSGARRGPVSPGAAQSDLNAAASPTEKSDTGWYRLGRD
jgi:hypothetical protein